jgi:hypothetical protein
MRTFLKLLREGSGRLIILIDWIFRPSIIKRSDEDQSKVNQQTKVLKLYQVCLLKNIELQDSETDCYLLLCNVQLI